MVLLYHSSHTLTDFLELKSNNIAAREYLVLADFADSLADFSLNKPNDMFLEGFIELGISCNLYYFYVSGFLTGLIGVFPTLPRT